MAELEEEATLLPAVGSGPTGEPVAGRSCFGTAAQLHRAIAQLRREHQAGAGAHPALGVVLDEKIQTLSMPQLDVALVEPFDPGARVAGSDRDRRRVIDPEQGDRPIRQKTQHQRKVQRPAHVHLAKWLGGRRPFRRSSLQRQEEGRQEKKANHRARLSHAVSVAVDDGDFVAPAGLGRGGRLKERRQTP